MSTYVIGDVHGCYRTLCDLLTRIAYVAHADTLYFLGDVVNRGPHSVEVLRFLIQQSNVHVFLGNHDVYALALGYGAIDAHCGSHTLGALLSAPDRAHLLMWLRHQSFAGWMSPRCMGVHAGIPPQWDETHSIQHARVLEAQLQGPQGVDFLKFLFQDHNIPQGMSHASFEQQLSYSVQVFTRMRWCTASGLVSGAKHSEDVLNDERPWFEWRPSCANTWIFFGHWAGLNGLSTHPRCVALDTGCVWGRSLSAVRLEDHATFHVPSRM